ncbi:hypothetical protein C2E23DRAFT_48536 [Lenzites betulinus]|nr:hypothetical protein C2E23DRAFT_48536 [Lenzites betulinus]
MTLLRCMRAFLGAQLSRGDAIHATSSLSGQTEVVCSTWTHTAPSIDSTIASTLYVVQQRACSSRTCQSRRVSVIREHAHRVLTPQRRGGHSGAPAQRGRLELPVLMAETRDWACGAMGRDVVRHAIDLQVLEGLATERAQDYLVVPKPTTASSRGPYLDLLINWND